MILNYFRLRNSMLRILRNVGLKLCSNIRHSNFQLVRWSLQQMLGSKPQIASPAPRTTVDFLTPENQYSTKFKFYVLSCNISISNSFSGITTFLSITVRKPSVSLHTVGLVKYCPLLTDQLLTVFWDSTCFEY